MVGQLDGDFSVAPSVRKAESIAIALDACLLPDGGTELFGPMGEACAGVYLAHGTSRLYGFIETLLGSIDGMGVQRLVWIVSGSQFGWGSKKRDRHDHPAVLLDGPPEQRDEGMKLKMVGGHAMWTWAWNASDHPA